MELLPNHALEPTATARLAGAGLGFEFASVAFGLALSVAVAQLCRSATGDGFLINNYD